MRSQPRTELQRISALARREFSSAHMSDTKWRKLFAALAGADLHLCQMVVKFIEGADARAMAFPSKPALHPPRPYIDTGEYGPIELRAIEWLEIPAIARLSRPHNVPAQQVVQDLDRVESTLTSIGRFPIERSSEALRVVAYIR